MNKALLPILARLHSLQVVSRLLPSGARLCASRSDPSPITVVLREINETILGRRMVFASEKGISLSLDVSGRRILRVVAAEGIADAGACLAAPALEDEHKDDLIRLLLGLAVPRHEIHVTTSPILQAPEGVSVGLPVALLADLLQVELNGLDAELVSDAPAPLQTPPAEAPPQTQAVEPVARGPILGRFARANGSVIMAWLILGGPEDATAEGPEEMVDHLRSFLRDEFADLTAQLDRIANPPGSPVCLTLGASLTTGHSIICARAEGGVLVGLAEGNCTLTLLPAWSKALAKA